MTDRFDNTEEFGLNEARRVVTEEFGWVFRDKNKRDFGIDAEIETKADGLIIQVQIKTGRSNFYFPTAGSHLVYYVKESHYRYWTNLKCPILFIAHLPNEKKIFWQVVKRETLIKENGKKNWQLNIPFYQTFTGTSKDEILDRFIEIPPPTLVFDPGSLPSQDASVTSNPVHLPRGRKISFDKEKKIFFSDDQKLNTWILSAHNEASLIIEIQDLRKKLRKDPYDINTRILLAEKYVSKGQHNDAIMELDEGVDLLREKIKKDGPKFPHRANLQFFQLCKKLLIQNHQSFLQNSSKIRPTIFAKPHLTGSHLHLWEVTVCLVYGDDEVDLVEYDYQIQTLPANVLAEDIFDGKKIGFRCKLKCHPSNTEVKPEVTGVTVEFYFGYSIEGKIHEDFATNLFSKFS